MVEHKPFKVNNSLLGVVAIFAIFLIIYMAITINPGLNLQSAGADVSGQAIQVLHGPMDPVCKLIVGQTTIYDDSTLATSLRSGDSTYYSGYTVGVGEINSNGCVVSINDNQDYIAVGQIQRIGPLYVTVKMVAE